jgi:trigger factor
VEYPPLLVEIEMERLFSDWLRRLQMDDKGLERYLASANKTQEELLEETRPAAVKRVTRGLVLGKVMEEEKIEVNDSDIDGEVERMVEKAGENADKMRNLLDAPQSRQSIKQALITGKTIERLLEIARGTEKAKPKDKEETK